MPDGPEIHRAATELAKAIEGERARDFFFAFARLKKYERRLSGQRVRAVEARGKAILTHFETGLTVFSHNHGREGMRCYRCGRAIARKTFGSRALFRCPACHKEGGERRSKSLS
jgi:formamidopyrimidine-DNA glycosylase